MNILNYGLFQQGGVVFPTTGLVSYWRMDESSGTIVYDSIGSNNLTNNDCVITTGKNNNGLLSNGSSDLIYGTNTMFDWERTDSWTFSTWVKLSTSGTGQGLMSKGIRSGVYTGTLLVIQASGTIDAFIINNSSNNLILISTTNTFTSTTSWYNIIWTYDGSSTAAGNKIYVNGTSQSFSTIANSLSASIKNTTAFRIAGYAIPVSPGGELLGIIDETAVFNRAITQSEVNIIYNGGTGRFY